MSLEPVRLRVITATDLHQSRLHYRSLALATQEHRPNVVAIVGDALHGFDLYSKYQFTTAECAKMLAELPVEHLLFVRGNHEEDNWTEFVAAWPHEQRKLTALYGTACAIGPLILVGFPCMTGSESNWCSHLQVGSNDMEMLQTKSVNNSPRTRWYGCQASCAILGRRAERSGSCTRARWGCPWPTRKCLTLGGPMPLSVTPRN
jgi:hypothetical protein